MEILIDVNGADKGIKPAIIGSIKALKNVESKIILVGKKEEILKVLTEEYGDKKAEDLKKQIGIIDAQDEITNDDEPSLAIKHKKESSIVKAYDYMKEKEETAFISAGSTGAVMAGGLLKLKRIAKVHRPALIAILPTDTGKGTILLDCGANTDAAPNSMVQYAEMGKLYASLVQNKENVSIGLLNIGAEETKGSNELKESNLALKEKLSGFIGNIEARDILKGKADVVVAQGLMGNVALKAIEGTAKTLKDALIKELKKNIFTKIRALVTKDILEKALYKYDYTKYGGAVLIGVRKPVVKIHGNAKAKNYEVAIYQANAILKQKLIKEIERKMNENEKV